MLNDGGRRLMRFVGTICSALFLYACNAVPTVEITSTAVQIDEGMTQVAIIIRNGMNMGITNVSLSVTCTSGSEPVIVKAKTLCDREVKRRVFNRMTGSYETRSWTVCDSLWPNETYRTQVSVPGSFDKSTCTISLDGYTDYRTLTQ